MSSIDAELAFGETAEGVPVVVARFDTRRLNEEGVVQIVKQLMSSAQDRLGCDPTSHIIRRLDMKSIEVTIGEDKMAEAICPIQEIHIKFAQGAPRTVVIGNVSDGDKEELLECANEARARFGI